MNSLTTVWPGSDLVRPAIQRPTSMRLAVTEYRRVLDTVDGLSPEDWTRPTECTGWDVRQLVAHMAGMAAFVSSPRELVRQVRASERRQQPGQASVDAQTALQVAERATATPEDLRAELRRTWPRAARGRRRFPGIARRLRLPGTQMVNGVPEAWSVGYLVEVILTRDPWMHRLDLARATGRAPELTEEHDGVLVADVVAEWARRHGQPYRLELTGPAGGRWTSGTGGEEITADAADFCRIVSGRRSDSGSTGVGLLAVQVPF
jgi:uncharacterized protein (TIGR03083 family)